MTQQQIKMLENSYKSNQQELKQIRKQIQNNGCLDNGLDDATESFEQGWNNALEYVFSICNIQI